MKNTNFVLIERTQVTKLFACYYGYCCCHGDVDPSLFDVQSGEGVDGFVLSNTFAGGK